MTKRGIRKTEVGIVVSNKMMQTITVKVERHVWHPRYGKMLKTFTTYKAHDEKNDAKMGDLVSIMETRPLSKTKRYRLVSIVQKAQDVPVIVADPEVVTEKSN